MRICVCDDDPSVRNEVKDYILTFSIGISSSDITELSSGEALIKHYAIKGRFDIIFIDVEMGGITGIAAAEKIRGIDPNVIIIFISNHAQYVFDSFYSEAFHYILKPIKKEEFAEVFNRALNKYMLMNTLIWLKWKGERFAVPIREIRYAKNSMRHMVLHTEDGVRDANGSVSDILEEIEVYGFLKINQSCIVNIDYIKRLTDEEVVLKDNTVLSISVRRRAAVLKAYEKFLHKMKW